MKKQLLLSIIMVIALMTCSKTETNPFYTEYKTPFGVPPFDQIKIEHFLPAIQKGIEEETKEIDAIINNTDIPTFENTILALEKSGDLLTKVNRTFSNIRGAEGNDEMNAIAKTIAPMLSKHRDDKNLNHKLFKRIENIHSDLETLNFNKIQERLVKDYYKSFVRSGVLLDDTQKEKIKKINEKLALLTLKFGENVLKEDNRFELVITDEKDLAGLSETSINSAKELANKKEYENSWVFSIRKPSMIPFLQYADNRELREKLYKGYINKGDNNDELDNKEIIKEIVQLRQQRAKLLGYETIADYILEERMAKTPEAVIDFSMKIWEPALDKAKTEAYDLQKLIEKDGHDFKLQSWDWWYYTEKLKKEKYGIDEEEVRQYFPIKNVRQGAFDVATKLFGLTFHKLENIPAYHEEVEGFEVKEANGTHVGVLYTDYHPRPGKRNGAWCTVFRKQTNLESNMIRPVVLNVCNFTRPSGDKPALISFDEVNTLFHEFGHALHQLLSNTDYPSFSGTSVQRDFVELPSQIMENWASDPEVLKTYAKHYKTGEPIPGELLEKIKKASQFNMGFITLEYMAASLLDMKWHTTTDFENLDVNKFESDVLGSIGMIPEIISRYRSTYFKHIFAGGYVAGYYSYIWAEVLDSDAYLAFKETSLYDKKTAQSYRENILEKGGTEDGMDLYMKFRGRKPEIDALLTKRGLN